MKTAPTLSFALAFALFLSASPPLLRAQLQAPPSRVDYQGQVLDSNGQPLAPDAPVNYSMIFRLYDVQTGGSPVWSETQTVTVSKGAFSVRLGEGIRVAGEPLTNAGQTADISQAFTGRDRYLGLTVVDPTKTTQQEITPRLAFLTAPYAFNAGKSKETESLAMLDAANNRLGSAKWGDFFKLPPAPAGTTGAALTTYQSTASNWRVNEASIPAGAVIPVGGVIMWWGASGQVPAGYEMCDGGLPAAGSTLTVRKPDLRDRFVKGSSSASGNVAAANSGAGVRGGLAVIPATTTGQTALTPAQLPAIPVAPGDLTANGAGEHSHVVRDQVAGSNISTEETGFVMGRGTGAVKDLGPTTVVGNHTHTVSGVLNREGSGQGHTHSVPQHSNLPPFLEMFFIIRVK